MDNGCLITSEKIMSKPKRKSKLVEFELLPDEDVLWQGKPILWKLFNAYDLFLIPFTVFWCSIALPMLYSGIRSGNPILILFPHAWIGLYMLFGRFIYKTVRKQHTWYVITNKRILLCTNLFGKHVQTFNLNHLPALSKAVGFGGIGNITFDEPGQKTWWNRRRSTYPNTGMDFFGHATPGFYDIHDVEAVYNLILEVTYGQSWGIVEKKKPAYVPR